MTSRIMIDGNMTQQILKAPSPVYAPTSNVATRIPCCETGRPVMAYPLTGSTVCSCQLQTGLPSYLSRVPSLPETMYGLETSRILQQRNLVCENAAQYYSAMYPTHRARDSRKSLPPSAQTPYYMDHIMAAHPYNNFFPGYDMNDARRKNATRENTNALKAWLHQHRKSPYPTKGEKIMLAVMTQMTMTQVSTWFANARRRLKKDRKLDGDKEMDLNDIDIDDTKSHDESFASRLSDSGSEPSAHVHNALTDLSDISDAEDQQTKEQSDKKCVQRHISPYRRDELFLDRISSPDFDSATDLSNISDAEHQQIKEQSAKKCMQRPFSPDCRDELFLDRLSSPDCCSSKVAQLNCNSVGLQSSKFVYDKNIHTLELKNKQNKSVPHVNVANRIVAEPKRNIWSIAEIIS